MPTNIKACFNGCSYTQGAGFDITEREQYVYDRLVTKNYDWDSTNISQPGSSNYTIFMRSAEVLLQNQNDILITQWSGLNRIWLSPGPETFYFVNDEKFPDYSYRDVYINSRTKKKLNELLLILNHDYQNIIDLVTYCNTLEKLAEATSTQLIFINGLIPWQDDLVSPFNNDLASTLSDYTKSILDFDNRSDNEIIEYFLKLQKQLSTLNKDIWVNLFESFQKNTHDIAPEGHHPGIQSHKWMADKIIDYIDLNLLRLSK